jgi:hypothetical protein
MKILGKFPIFCFNNNNNKLLTFELLNRENVLAFLNSFRKPEASDSLHKWIGTYNLYRIH